MIAIGGNALEAIEQGLLQGADVFVRVQAGNEIQIRAPCLAISSIVAAE